VSTSVLAAACSAEMKSGLESSLRAASFPRSSDTNARDAHSKNAVAPAKRATRHGGVCGVARSCRPPASFQAVTTFVPGFSGLIAISGFSRARS
jgi:hypothetical protein